MTGINGRVDQLNKDTYATLQSIKQKNQGRSTLSETDAQTLSKAIMKDGKIDAAESDLLVELTQDQNRVIKVSPEKSNNPVDISFVTTSGKARSILQETLTPTSKLNALFAKGADGFKELTEIYQRSPADEERVVGFLSGKAMEAWNNSSLSNGYGPLRGMIMTAYSGIGKLEGQDNTAGRNMLHRAIARIDTNNDGSNGAIPDFLYNWIRPGGLI